MVSAEFSEYGVEVWVSAQEYTFLFRCVAACLDDLDGGDISARLATREELALAVFDELGEFGRAARESGHQWVPDPDRGLDG